MTNCLNQKAAKDTLRQVGVSPQKSEQVVAYLKKSVDSIYPQLSLTQRTQLIRDKVFDSAETIATQIKNSVKLSNILKTILKKTN